MPISRRFLRSMLDTLTGAVICIWLSLTAALLGQTWRHPLLFLILFVPAVGVIARLWGLSGAILGLVSSLVVFRVGLFVPLGRLEVTSPDARAGLFWTVVGAGIVVYVLARPQHRRRTIRKGGESC